VREPPARLHHSDSALGDKLPVLQPIYEQEGTEKTEDGRKIVDRKTTPFFCHKSFCQGLLLSPFPLFAPVEKFKNDRIDHQK
jgi:hypothetical protein